ncbi:NUDIX hydrolase [Quadrisphaera setariae]|uniref:NUDIX hydrolase n=1 Tax=Quadrisphaera setariae TaxID=2593304 RepID=A0A5C8ZDT2_9ACTN|nr:NUDIX hydrolase [Quadrisphaera setariae]TXR55977.1 NUDIX hydrolase [Quadrisphaera setariae]
MAPGDRRPTPGRRRRDDGRDGGRPGQRPSERGGRTPWRGGGRTVEEVSAGGIVVETSTGEARAALIARLNRAGRLEWCLPKGHLEGAETPQEAAVREVAEETGITGVVVGELGTIDYWFSAEGRRIHKTVHHYLLEATGGAISVDGDPDAEAVEAAWVPVTQLGQRLAFSNERRIARAASALLASGG